MTPRLCRELTGLEEAGLVLAKLHRKNYFTAQHFSSHELIYQYHPLFREFLLARAQDIFPVATLAPITCRAAQILENAGAPEDAARLYGETGQWDSMAHLILKNAPALMENGRTQVVAQWLRQLPAEVAADNPWLLYWQGTCRLAAAPREARGVLEQAYRLFQAADDPMGLYLTWCAIIDSFIYDTKNLAPLNHWIEEMQQFTLSHPVFPAPEIEARTAACMLFALLLRQPEERELDRWAAKVESLLGQCPSIGFQTLIMLPLVLHHIWFGRLSELGLLLQEFKEKITSPEINPFSALSWMNFMSIYLLLTGRPAEGLEMVQQGVQLAQKTGVNFGKVFSYTHAVHCALALGDLPAAEVYLENMAADLPETRPLDVAHYYFLQGQVALLRGEVRQSLEYAEMSLKLTEDCGSLLQIALSRILLAEARFEYGFREEAVVQLQEVRDNHDLKSSRLLKYRCLIAQTHFALEMGRIEEGRLYLQDLMQLGKATGYVNTYGWRPQVMARVCRRALEDGIETEYVRELIKTGNLHPEPEGPPLENWPYPLKIYTLGTFRIFLDGQARHFSGKVQQKPLRLLKALIALGGKDVPVDLLANALWPEAEGDLAHISFKTTLHRLRRMLGREKLLELQEGRLSLDERYCWVDARAFQRMCGQAENQWQKAAAGPAQSLSPESPGDSELDLAVRCTEKCLALYQGLFLPTELDESWTVSRREKLRQRFFGLIMQAGKYWEAADQWEQAVAWFRKGVAIDESAEEFYQHLMTGYQRLGQEAAALDVYRRCRTMLAATLGVKPSSQTESIHRRLRQ